MTIASDDEYVPDATAALTPGTDGAEAAEEHTSDASRGPGGNPSIPKRVDWLLPDDSDHNGDDRTGVLSTYVEVHALVIGLAMGTHAGATGDVQLIADLIGVGAAGSRLQKGLPDKFREQIIAELPYFIAGVAIGYTGMRYGPLLVGGGGA